MLQAKDLFDACYIAWFADSVKPMLYTGAKRKANSPVRLARELASHVKRHTQLIADRFATDNK